MLGNGKSRLNKLILESINIRLKHISRKLNEKLEVMIHIEFESVGLSLITRVRSQPGMTHLAHYEKSLELCTFYFPANMRAKRSRTPSHRAGGYPVLIGRAALIFVEAGRVIALGGEA